MPTLRAAVGLSVIAVFAVTSVRAISARVAADRAPVVAPTLDATADTVAVLAGGCFWGVEAVFRHVKGVHTAESGFTDGAESVRLTYDPKVVSYGTLLRVFFSVVHDPTQLDRQGPDRGAQYRSAVFYASQEQKKVVTDYIAQLTAAHAYDKPIVTELAPLSRFSVAAVYHQDYARKNPNAPYIVINDHPKIAALEKNFPALWRDPAL
ncbi:MAG: peptide-methionine (S)-S-oxide reductase MsrA [Gemmatimonadaceae bacterium]